MKRTRRQVRTNSQTDLIKALLRARHQYSEDVFIEECPVGVGALGYIDAWAVAKSWAKPMTTGYEIKVSRRDFLRDDKWIMYLPYCNNFYFVVPSGMVKVNEVSEEAGLIYLANGGKKLYVKRKAVRRHITPGDLESIYKAVLMSRVIITDRSTYVGANSETERARISNKASRVFWESFVNAKEEDRAYGMNLRGKIRRIYDDRIKTVESDNRELRRKILNYEAVEGILNDLGVDVGAWDATYQLRDRLTGQDTKALIHNLSDFKTTARSAVSFANVAIDKLKRFSREDG